MKYVKKPVVIEAVQWNGNNREEIELFMDNAKRDFTFKRKDCFSEPDEWDLIIHTLEGDHKANIGDFIIKGIKGEFYPCKPDIFELTYDKI